MANEHKNLHSPWSEMIVAEPLPRRLEEAQESILHKSWLQKERTGDACTYLYIYIIYIYKRIYSTGVCIYIYKCFWHVGISVKWQLG